MMTRQRKSKPSSVSSSSGRTVQSKTTTALLALGAKLVEQFKLREDEDTLGQWIAHHLAEKLSDYSEATGEAKAALEVELVDTILKFWKHRAHFPRGTRPFEGYDAVLRALESFDPEPDDGRYFRYQASEELSKNAPPGAKSWIDLAKSLDRGAKTMVSFCFRQAARASQQADEVWLSAANVLAEDVDLDIDVIRVLRAGTKEDDKEIDPLEFEKKQLKKKKDDLLELMQGALYILGLVKNRLEELGVDDSKPETSEGKLPTTAKAKRARKATVKTKRGASTPRTSNSLKKKAPTRKRTSR